MSKQTPPTHSTSTVGPCPTVIQISQLDVLELQATRHHSLFVKNGIQNMTLYLCILSCIDTPLSFSQRKTAIMFPVSFCVW